MIIINKMKIRSINFKNVQLGIGYRKNNFILQCENVKYFRILPPIFRNWIATMFSYKHTHTHTNVYAMQTIEISILFESPYMSIMFLSKYIYGFDILKFFRN